MPVKGKKLKERYSKISRNQTFTPDEALALLKTTCEETPMKFDETVEACIRLGIDPRKPEQNVRGTISLPNGTGRVPRIAVFAQGEHVAQAEAAGADFVGADELAEKVKGGWTDFDVAIATPDMMKVVGPLGKILGPRGLMPNPKTGTVTFNVKDTVDEFKKGKVEYRNDKFGNVSIPIGRVSFDAEKLAENFMEFYRTMIRVKPSAAKGQYMRSAAVSSTQGPGLKINLTAISK
jgi:large subunit ribosomal protein L1